jgi:5S rRNA maturation endonuclease (ribonuclease M5)
MSALIALLANLVLTAALSSLAGSEMRHEIRAMTGQIVAVHCRRTLPNGKKLVWWMSAHGTRGLRGLRTADLPLYLSERERSWSSGVPVLVVEGEPAADALARLGYQVVATVTGAATTPSEASLSVLRDRDVVVWPDCDEPGRRHMDNVAGALQSVALSIRQVEWGTRAGDDAADAVDRGADVAAILDTASAARVTPQSRAATGAETFLSPARPRSTMRTAICDFNSRHGVCEVLQRDWNVVDPTPGRTVRCPAHDDRSPSLSIAADDKRVWCHSPSCLLNGQEGQGHDPFSLAVVAEGLNRATQVRARASG